jgi:hypothetical protein
MPYLIFYCLVLRTSLGNGLLNVVTCPNQFFVQGLNNSEKREVLQILSNANFGELLVYKFKEVKLRLFSIIQGERCLLVCLSD